MRDGLLILLGQAAAIASIRPTDNTSDNADLITATAETGEQLKAQIMYLLSKTPKENQ